LLEKLRLLNSIDPKKGQVLELQPGKSAEVAEVVVEEVRGHHELWLRLRALFTTIALTSVNKPSYFSFQDCENFCDLVQTYLYQRFDGCLAPVQHFVQAYLATMQYFQNEVRTNTNTLKKAIKKTANWQHFWTFYQKPQTRSA
jgi:hypothetical protein